MKRFCSIFFVLVFLVFLCPAVFAAEDTFADISELYNHWESEGYPDWVSAVFSTDTTADHLSVLLTVGSEDKEAELRSLLRDDGSLQVLTGGEFSHNELQRISEEIVKNHMGSGSSVVACGIGWTTVNGVVTGFGPSGKESRVCVTVLEANYEKYTKLFAETYGDAVYVESGSIPFAEDTASAAIIGEADGPTSIFISGNPIAEICGIAGAVLIAGLAVFLIVRRKKRRNTTSEKKS